MKKYISTTIAIISLAFTLQAQNVNIPDANFKSYLLNNNFINTDSDKLEISVSEAITFNGKIDVSDRFITSLVGIESFVNLTTLICNNNQLTSLDLTNNSALDTLKCNNNQLSSLDVTKNTTLTYFECFDNQLTSIDVTNNIALSQFYCISNQLTSINVSKNTALTHFNCSDNQLTSLDVTKINGLVGLWCNNNQITSLDVTNNIALTMFECYSNQLSSLDVTKINILVNFESRGNPNLTCIQALNSQDKTNWTKDEAAQYAENCNLVQGIKEENTIQTKTILATYNLHGQSVKTNYQGLVIIRYTDGTSEKVVQ